MATFYNIQQIIDATEEEKQCYMAKYEECEGRTRIIRLNFEIPEFNILCVKHVVSLLKTYSSVDVFGENFEFSHILERQICLQ